MINTIRTYRVTLFNILPIVGVLTLGACSKKPGEFPNQELLCHLDTDREIERELSAQSFPEPVITEIWVDGNQVWGNDITTTPTLKPGDIVTLVGEGFGLGTDIDFSKIMIGNSRVLETDLKMYEQKLALADQVNYEIPKIHSRWDKDVIGWSEEEITFRVPIHASKGPLRVQIQKRINYNKSLIEPTESHNVIDALTSRIIDSTFEHQCDIVSEVSDTKSTSAIAVHIQNNEFENLVARGEEAFWSYDYNIGTAHAVRKLNWTNLFNGKAKDPITGLTADPELLFGAYPTVAGQVPTAAMDDVYFDTYPQPSPIPGWLTLFPSLKSGNTRDSGYVGYRFAKSNHPYVGIGEWIGFNCASCHGYRINYEKTPGNEITKVIPGLPNPVWSMKWTILDQDFKGIHTNEAGPSWEPGAKAVDKTMLIYHMPQGAGEHNMVRIAGEGSHTDNDYQFSPIAIPSVTNYMPIRRSLSHTESYVGFEGSYIHSEEPDGAQGSMKAEWLQALTAYMTVLDKDDDDLRNVGLFRWLRFNTLLDTQVAKTDMTEGEFVSAGWQHYSGVVDAVNAGKAIYDRDCGSCHTDNLGAHTNEQMIPLNEVGRFFAPTIYQKEVQSIRTSFLRDLYWVQHRGLLSDGHVKNLEDLVDPARCTENSELYNEYYTLHSPVTPALGGPDHPEPYPSYNRRGDVFRVPVSASSADNDIGAKRNRFIERHKYFVQVPWDPDFYYWDYQKMRSEYGPSEMGTHEAIGLPAAPHPWCAKNHEDIQLLVQYLLTL